MPPLVTSSFLSCDLPLPTDAADIAGIQSGLAANNLFTTRYEVTLPAACPTSAWTATYTVTQVCSGDPATWAIPSVFPNFDVTTVVCHVCETPTQAITCPNALGTEPAVINGNGVTMTAAPTRAPGEGYGPGFGPGEGGAGGRFGNHQFGPGGTEGSGADSDVTTGETGPIRAAPAGSPTQGGNSPVVTAGASSRRNGLAFASGIAVVLGSLLVL